MVVVFLLPEKAEDVLVSTAVCSSCLVGNDRSSVKTTFLHTVELCVAAVGTHHVHSCPSVKLQNCDLDKKMSPEPESKQSVVQNLPIGNYKIHLWAKYPFKMETEKLFIERFSCRKTDGGRIHFF